MCIGDRFLPARAVPGDGAIPLERILGWLLEAGYLGRSISSCSARGSMREGHLAGGAQRRRAVSAIC